MTPRLRKFALTVHVSCSVGWLGAVAGFLPLAVAGMSSENLQMVRAAYLAMELTAWHVIVPLSLAAVLTGIVQSLGTQWGLLRHYWILAKLLISVFSTVILLIYMRTLGDLAGVAADVSSNLAMRSPSPVVHATAALILLIAATVLAIYKPWGRTRF